MGTVVDIQVVEKESKEYAEAQILRAFEAFRKVELACSRFSEDSELIIACSRIKTWIPISPYLFEPLRFALEIAEWTNGLFDPSVGKTMEKYGFNRHYLSHKLIESTSDDLVTYHDIELNVENKSLFLKKPLVIDLGAVAKGFAIDLAAHELRGFDGFLINAGGDVYAGGLDENGNVWKVGIQHPIQKEKIIHTIEISNQAICTSGSYERKSTKIADIHHLINPQTKLSPNDWISCSVIAPYAMMADALSTAAFVMGLDEGPSLINQAELDGILITSDLQIVKIGGI
jgi:thiamine biosynthesis lipoprotein